MGGAAGRIITIENCKVDGCVNAANSAGGLVGGISTGRSGSKLTIKNCINKADVTGERETGGIAGKIFWGDNGYSYEDCVISGCVNQGKIKGVTQSGGIVGGFTHGPNSKEVIVEKCTNFGNVEGQNYTGGILGWFYASDTDESSLIEQCCNVAEINGITRVGGICGAYQGHWCGMSKILDSYNHGTINGDTYVGGLVGYSTSTHCNLYIQCSYNIGKVIANSKSTSIVGRLDSVDKMLYIDDTYYLENTSEIGSEGNIKNLTCLTKSQFTKAENFEGFDFDNVWKMGVEYPIFQWQDSENGGGNAVGELDVTVDEYIISEVKKYTSDIFCAQYQYIMDSDISYEVRLKFLNDLFRDYGITDVNEGVDYVSDTTAYRNNYLYLTTNDAFCANNFTSWLFSPEGTIPRGLLYADGLIFNWEIGDWFNLDTYIESDYPGAKKNKAMLKEFMGTMALECEVYQKANETVEFLKNLITLNDLVETEEMDYLMDQILECDSNEELEKLQKQFADTYITPYLDSDVIYLNGEKFSKALGYASNIMEFVGSTTDDILGILNLSNEIAIYQKYNEFLTTVCLSTDVSRDMRIAAHSLLNEIEEGYYNKIYSIIKNAIDFTDDVMELDIDVLDKLLESLGGEGLKTLQLAVFISNIVIDMGDFVNQAAYTMGYAELGVLYSLKLQQDKQKFQSSPTAENAWQFFEDYTILWNLRVKGEEKYLEMNSVKAFIFADIKTSKYYVKEELVKDALNRLDDCKFEIAPRIMIPASVQYMKKAVIHCPVNVDVYNSDGQLIVSLLDGKECDIANEYGRFVVIYQPYNGEYEKIICQSTDEDLNIVCTAVADGLVDYQFASKNEDDAQVLCFDNVFVGDGDVIEVDTKSEQEKTFAYYEGGKEREDEPIVEALVEKIANTYVAVESVKTDISELELENGETHKISFTVSPKNATNPDLLWSSLDESVLTVKNGKISTVGIGTAIIQVKAMDSSDIMSEIMVTVKEKVESLESSVVDISQQIYEGKPVEPQISVKFAEFFLVAGTDYTVLYLNNEKPGTATAIINGCGKYTGIIEKNFKIVCEHKYTPWTTKKSPTVFVNGTQTRTCSICKKTQSKVLAKLKPTIKINVGKTLPIKVGQYTNKIKVNGLAKGDSVYKWTSSNSKVVTVNAKTGAIKAVGKAGKSAVISVYLASNKKTPIKSFTVKLYSSAVATNKINGLKSKITLAKGKRMVLKPSLYPVTAVNKITYSSSNRKIVTVNSAGKITGIKKGTAYIIVKSGTITKRCKVIVR